MPYYLIEHEYVGPNQHCLATDYNNIVNGHYFVIQDRPGLTNMSHEPRTEGWLGTTNDWSETALGEYPTEKAAEKAVLEKLQEIGVGYRMEEPDPGDVIVWSSGEEVCRKLATYYVGDDTWANLLDAGEWLQDVSDQELGLYAGMSEEEQEAVCSRLESEARSAGARLWGLEEEIMRRVDELSGEAAA